MPPATLQMFEKARRNHKLSDLFGLLVVGVLVLCFCRDLVFTGKVPFFRDLVTYFYPLRFTLYQSYHTGTLPLWNRHMAMGFPFLAEFQSGVLYPPHLFLALFPFFTAIRLLFIFHFLLAGVGTYKLFRHWDYPVYLSIIGALLFSLGGTTVALTNLLNHFQTAVWLPWLILYWDQFLKTLSWRQLVTLVIVTASAFLAGSPEIFVLSMVLVFVASLGSQSKPRLPFSKTLLFFISVHLLILAVVMVQALPTGELFFESRRQQAIPTIEAFYWSLKPASLLNLFFIDKEITPDFAVGLRPFWATDVPFLISHYIGAFSLFGIALWFCFASLREKGVLLGLLFFSLILAFGSYTPIYPFLSRALPVIGTIRFPEKFFFFSFALLVYIATRGGKLFLHEQQRSEKKAFVVMSVICAIWVGVYLYFRFDVASIIHFVGIVGDANSKVSAELIANILSNMERQVVLSCGIFGLLILGKTKRIREVLFVILLASIVFIDIAWANKDYLFVLAPDFVQKSPRVLQMVDGNTSRLFYYPAGHNLHPGSVTVRGQPTFRDATALSIENLLPNTGLFYGLDYMQDIDALGRKPYSDFLRFANDLDFDRQLRLLRLCNVGYLLSFRELSAKGITRVGTFPQFYSWLYRINGNMPRAYVVSKVRTVKDSAGVLPTLSDPAFDPNTEVVLEGDGVIKKSSHSLQAMSKMLRYEDSVAEIQVATNEDAFLVLTDSYYPGWRAYVDGNEVKILRANHFFRGVAITQGTHWVEFRYEPLSFKIGFTVSMLTVLCLMIVSAIVFLRKCTSLSFKSDRELVNP
jgi:hypothetical protein